MSSHVTSTIVNVVISAITALIVSRVSKTSLSRVKSKNAAENVENCSENELKFAEKYCIKSAEELDYKTICKLVELINCCLSGTKPVAGAGATATVGSCCYGGGFASKGEADGGANLFDEDDYNTICKLVELIQMNHENRQDYLKKMRVRELKKMLQLFGLETKGITEKWEMKHLLMDSLKNM